MKVRRNEGWTMKRPLIALVCVAAGSLFLGPLAASEPDPISKLAGDREKVRVDLRTDQAPLAARAFAARGKKKPVKVFYGVANSSDTVPANGSTPIFVLQCPQKAKAISGQYFTDGFVVNDWNGRGSTSRKWELAFSDVAGADGEVLVGIVCLKNA